MPYAHKVYQICQPLAINTLIWYKITDNVTNSYGQLQLQAFTVLPTAPSLGINKGSTPMWSIGPGPFRPYTFLLEGGYVSWLAGTSVANPILGWH